MSGLILRLSRAVGIVIAAAGLCSTVTTLGPLTQHAAASTTVSLSCFDARLLADINRARSANGIRRLIVVAGTTDVAHGWSCRLASLRSLAHNPSLASQLASHGSANWTAYGENVGMVASTAGARAIFLPPLNNTPPPARHP